jgi:hypothetical protein
MKRAEPCFIPDETYEAHWAHMRAEFAGNLALVIVGAALLMVAGFCLGGPAG